MFERACKTIMAGRKPADMPDMDKRPDPPPPLPLFAELAKQVQDYNEDLLVKMTGDGLVGEWKEQVNETLENLYVTMDSAPTFCRIRGNARAVTYAWRTFEDGIELLRDEYHVEDTEALEKVREVLGEWLDKIGVDPRQGRGGPDTPSRGG